MKNFLTAFHEMIEEKMQNNEISNEIKSHVTHEYQRLSEDEQEKSILILSEILQDYDLIVYFISMLLSMTQDKRILHFLEEILIAIKYPLWYRLNDMSNLQAYLFINSNLYEEKKEYQNLKNMYLNILGELQLNMKRTYPYIPYAERNKHIVIVVKMLLSIEHAPTKLTRYVYNYYQSMGYEVECFVCHLEAREGHWYVKYLNNNFCKETAFFQYKLGETKIKGCNLVLQSKDYSEILEYFVGIIWNKKPEFVMEIGDQTILAGLCTGFTTVLSMGCTKNLPITNAPLIASIVSYSEEEQQMHNRILESTQRVVEVKCDIQEINVQEQGVTFSKEMFDVPKDSFVIIIAGNRLDYEIDESFIKIMYQILEMDAHFVIAVIGHCPILKERMKDNRIFFWGVQSNFREAIAAGDVFLNPPRQGGGTGGIFAVLEEVPVITLGNCDVEINAGSEFVCESIEEMPQLVYKYFSDPEFMEQQKENCRKRSRILLDVDHEQDLRKLCRAVKEYALQTEQNFAAMQT